MEDRIEMLTLIKETRRRHTNMMGLFLCECGREKEIMISDVKSGRQMSCGCLRNRKGAANPLSNMVGDYTSTNHPLYAVWTGMKERTDPESNNRKCKYYRDRGITMSPLWRSSFSLFVSYMSGTGMVYKPTPEHSIDRVDNDKGYFPGNIRWATPLEQSENRSVSRMETYNGITKSIGGWERYLGLNRGSLRNRINKGCTITEAIECPKGTHLKTYRKSKLILDTTPPTV